MRGGILAFLAGIWLLQQQATLPSPWWWGVPLLLASWGAHQPSWRRLLLLTAAFACGFLWAAALAQWRLNDALAPAWEGREIVVTGTVAEMPRAAGYGTRFLFEVERTATPDAVVPRRLLLTWYAPRRTGAGAPPPALHAAERWRLAVRLKRPHGNANPHGFDYEAWLLERNIRATGYVVQDGENWRLADSSHRPGPLMERLRERVAEHLRASLDGRPDGGILLALTVGEQNAISPVQWQVFSRTGVTHLMSISGLHVTLVAGLFSWAAFFLWRRAPRWSLFIPARRIAVLAGFVAALAYAWLAGFSLPTQRTVWMLGVVAAALWRGKRVSPSRILAAALLAVLVADPWAVLSPGFWLSFGAVGLILGTSAGRIGMASRLWEWGRVQWAITVGLTPLLLALFQQVSLVSPLANAFAIPLVSLAVTPLALLGAVSPWSGPLLLAHQLMTWCMAALETLASVPDAVWQQHAPLPWTVAAATVGAAWLLLPRGFPARWLGAFAMAPMFLVHPLGPKPGELWLTVLDVGQGLAVVARTAHHALLFDAGPRLGEDASAGERAVVPFLRGEGVGALDGLVISHDDIDHFGGASAVLDAVPVGWMASSLPPAHFLHARVAQSWPCRQGLAWSWDGVGFAFLHPDARTLAEKTSDNERGCVLRVESAQGRALIAADIGHGTEERLVARYGEELAADVLVVPHHGSRFSSTEEFVAAVRPRLAVVSAGYRNRFGHPAAEVARRYQGEGAVFLRTDRDGAVSMRFAAGRLELQPWRSSRVRYWNEPAPVR